MNVWTNERLAPLSRNETGLLCGTGCYVDDIHVPGEVHGYVLRSPHAHARIRAIDVAAARAAPGVLAVLTGVEVARLVSPLGCVMSLVSEDGTPRVEADRAVLAVERVRHVGDGVAFVVAQTRGQAEDAAAGINVDYEVLPAVTEPDERPVAMPIWQDAADNVCFNWRFGDAVACRRRFEAASHVAHLTLRSPRVAPTPIEPRGAIGTYDAGDDRYTLIANSQGVHFIRRVLAGAFAVPEANIRVVTPNVGGGFGSKIFCYPEHALVLCAARVVGRPVRWIASRTEAFLSDTQGRGHVTEAALALDANANFLAISVRTTVNLGAYLSQYAPITATGVGAPVQCGAYRFQAIDIAVRGVFTNTVPVDSYRGAGRPEATYVLERLINRAAADLGIDPAELRARNLPEAQDETFTAVTGLMVEGGRFLDNQRRCLDAADRAGFAGRRAASAQRGLLRGFGLANYLESNGGLAVARMIEPDHLPTESVFMRFGSDGGLEIIIGTQSTGQDHATPLVAHASRMFGLAPGRVVVRQGDSDALARGGGTGGSKSLLTSSVALEQGVADVVGRGRALLAGRWATEPSAIHFETGTFSLPGSNRSASIADLAAAFPGTLDGESRGVLKHGSCANGCHACEVEIDPDTGETHVVRYTAVDDFGRVVNEAAVLGQVQGGVVQGLGQALMERAAYDPDSGQLNSASLLDYALPRASDGPAVAWINNGLPSPSNLFGAKACGEAGVSAAPAAIMNALADALASCPASDRLQMPARPVDIWGVIHAVA